MAVFQYNFINLQVSLIYKCAGGVAGPVLLYICNVAFSKVPHNHKRQSFQQTNKFPISAFMAGGMLSSKICIWCQQMIFGLTIVSSDASVWWDWMRYVVLCARVKHRLKNLMIRCPNPRCSSEHKHHKVFDRELHEEWYSVNSIAALLLLCVLRAWIQCSRSQNHPPCWRRKGGRLEQVQAPEN